MYTFLYLPEPCDWKSWSNSLLSSSLTCPHPVYLNAPYSSEPAKLGNILAPPTLSSFQNYHSEVDLTGNGLALRLVYISNFWDNSHFLLLSDLLFRRLSYGIFQGLSHFNISFSHSEDY